MIMGETSPPHWTDMLKLYSLLSYSAVSVLIIDSMYHHYLYWKYAVANDLTGPDNYHISIFTCFEYRFIV